MSCSHCGRREAPRGEPVIVTSCGGWVCDLDCRDLDALRAQRTQAPHGRELTVPVTDALSARKNKGAHYENEQTETIR